MPIPYNAKSGDFTTGSHDGTRMNTEFDRLYANCVNLLAQVENALGVAAGGSSEVIAARNGRSSLDAIMDELLATKAELETARSSVGLGAYSTLDARLEAMEARVNTVLAGTTSGAEVIDARTDSAGKAWSVLADAVNKGSKDLEGLTLAAVSKLVVSSATLKDVFIYDTSKDSDGGSWRKRCQHLSWYNETLNTSTRGKTREFPALALILATTTTLVVYDLTDPTVPMWAVFNTGGNFSLHSGTNNAVTAFNGNIYVGMSTQLVQISLLSDRSLLRNTTSLYINSANLSNRNVTGQFVPTLSSGAIVNATVNDVSVTMLPNAPIDFMTGLPTPTIAAATPGGVSVIHNNGNVVNWLTDKGQMQKVSFIGSSITTYGGDGLAFRLYVNSTIPVSSTNTADQTYSSSSVPARIGSDFNDNARIMTSNEKEIFFSIGVLGFQRLSPNISSMSQGMAALIRNDFFSGWLPGDIRGAWLASGLAETLAGAELITNGGFDADVSWSKGAGWTIAAGVATHAAASGANVLSQNMGGVSGRRYLVTFTVSGRTAGTVYASVGGNVSGTTRSTNGTFSEYLTWGTNPTIYMQPDSAFDGSIDNVSVRICDEDRSVKAKGLAVYGSITKAAVATNAELIGYSGFSSLNYLEQPYNSDLDFGTADFAFLWASKCASGISSISAIFARCAYSAGFTGNGLIQAYYQTTGAMVVNISDDNASTVDSITSTQLFNDNAYHMFAFVRRSTALELWCDGVKIGTATVTNANLGVSNTSATLRVGLRQDGNLPATAVSVAMLRATAYAPTDDQIRQIHAQERMLFQDGAKCLLGGTSNAVAGLAYDSDTDRLAVATGNGVSYFTGLRRVDLLNGGNAPITTSAMVAITAARGASVLATSAEAAAIIPQRNDRELHEKVNPMPAVAIQVTAPTLTNSWANSGGSAQVAGYYKDMDGVVHLRGSIGGGTIGQAAFTLPPGYRPGKDNNYAIVSNGAFGAISITSAGVVTPSAGATTAVSLAGVSFLAEA